MKRIKIFSTLLAVVLLFTACNTEVQKAIYEPTGDGVSFLSTVYVDTEVPASNSTIDITIARETADAALTVNLSNTFPEGIACPSAVTFNAGEYATNVTLDVSAMSVGVTKKGTISITSDVCDANHDIASVTCTIAKAYTWNSLGTGFFYEGFLEGFLGEVEVKKAEGYDRYRIMDPYAISAESDGSNPAYIEFWVTNADGNVQWNTFKTGYDYSGSGDYIKGYWPSELNTKYASKEAYSGFYEKDIVVFYPCWYMDNLGGWASSYYPIALCLPGRTEAQFISWIEENL